MSELSDYIAANKPAWDAKDARIAELTAQRDALVSAGNLALKYWADRQQRYKNRYPVWVQDMRAALVL